MPVPMIDYGGVLIYYGKGIPDGQLSSLYLTPLIEFYCTDQECVGVFVKDFPLNG